MSHRERGDQFTIRMEGQFGCARPYPPPDLRGLYRRCDASGIRRTDPGCSREFLSPAHLRPHQALLVDDAKVQPRVALVKVGKQRGELASYGLDRQLRGAQIRTASVSSGSLAADEQSQMTVS